MLVVGFQIFGDLGIQRSLDIEDGRNKDKDSAGLVVGEEDKICVSLSAAAGSIFDVPAVEDTLAHKTYKSTKVNLTKNQMTLS